MIPSGKLADREGSARPPPRRASGRGLPAWGLAALAVLVVAVAVAAACWLVPRAQDRLDPSFGQSGIVTTAIAQTDYRPIADPGPAVVDPEGRTVVGGLEGWDFAVARYTPEGRADASFGFDGLVRTRVDGAGRVRGLAVQPDGRVLAVGDVGALTPGEPSRVVLARYLANGDLDAGFGTGGLVSAPGWNGPAAVAVQPDGRILVAGTGLARFTSDGSPDGSFGKGGLVEVPGDALSSVALQPDGRIVVAGDVLARYGPDGAPDETFGSGGVADVAGLGGIEALALQSDGGIVAAGGRLARYTADGRPDPGFASGGSVAPVGTGVLHAVAIQADGRIVVGGTAAGEDGRFVLARYEADGTADATFGDAGVLTTEVEGQDAGVRALAIQRDGKIVAAGHRRAIGCSLLGGCGGPGVNTLLIARYDGR